MWTFKIDEEICPDSFLFDNNKIVQMFYVSVNFKDIYIEYRPDSEELRRHVIFYDTHFLYKKRFDLKKLRKSEIKVKRCF